MRGDLPARNPLPVTDAACRALHPGGMPDESVLRGRGGALANVFVWVADGLPRRRWPAVSDAVVLRQRGCRFAPRVFGMRPGQRLEIVNADPVLHNVHALPKRGRGFNAAMPPRETPWSIIRTLPREEVMVRIRCDIHGWMAAWAGVVDHPYFAVTGPDGRFTIPDLPPGAYEIRYWHETFGTRSRKVVLPAGGRATADVTYEGKG